MTARTARALLRERMTYDTRKAIALRRVDLRTPTATLRRLPDFLLIGTMRGGTSSLFTYLAAHPGVGRSLRKEVEFFTRYHDRGPRWYQAHFPLRARGVRTFEATPDYLFDPAVPARAAACVPQARLVVLLRDPVARAISHHGHMVRLGFEPLGLADAVEAEAERLAADLALPDDADRSPAYYRFSYVHRGDYAEQLERWLRWYPREQLLVLPSEALYRDPAATYRRVLDFLELRPWEPAEFRNHSYAAGARPSARRPEASEQEVRRRLTARYADGTRRLRDLLGEDFGWPLEAVPDPPVAGGPS